MACDSVMVMIHRMSRQLEKSGVPVWYYFVMEWMVYVVGEECGGEQEEGA